MNEVCHDVEVEPKLQLLHGESFVNNSTTTEDEALRQTDSGVHDSPALSLV